MAVVSDLRCPCWRRRDFRSRCRTLRRRPLSSAQTPRRRRTANSCPCREQSQHVRARSHPAKANAKTKKDERISERDKKIQTSRKFSLSLPLFFCVNGGGELVSLKRTSQHVRATHIVRKHRIYGDDIWLAKRLLATEISDLFLHCLRVQTITLNDEWKETSDY